MTDKIDILRRYTAQPGPVDTVGLIRALGIDYAEEPMPAGDSGRIVCDAEGRCRIIVNMAERPQRKRFTAAHELAHFLLHRDLLDARGHLDRLFDEAAMRNPDSPLSHKHEVQANRFAADLLMPAAEIRADYDPRTDNVAELAKRFDVSKKAMTIRLKSLGLIDRVE